MLGILSEIFLFVSFMFSLEVWALLVLKLWRELLRLKILTTHVTEKYAPESLDVHTPEIYCRNKWTKMWRASMRRAVAMQPKQ